MEYYDDFPEAPEDYYELGTPDSYFLGVQEDIRSLYEKDKQTVFYIRQLQVRFEKKYFHWITNNALIGLFKLGYLKDLRIIKEVGTSTRYFFHKSNRYPKRKVNEIEKIIEEYSQDHITRSCGHRAEDLFCNALAMNDFSPKVKKVKEFNEKRWEKTGHDLDFIFTKDGIGYGCEIKKTLGYIEKEELEIKLEMCDFFGVKPLFIMRYSPKSYNKMIIDEGGFALIFESQIYELSQLNLVKKIKERIGLPVDCPRSIPEGIIKRFVNWHERQKM